MPETMTPQRALAIINYLIGKSDHKLAEESLEKWLILAKRDPRIMDIYLWETLLNANYNTFIKAGEQKNMVIIKGGWEKLYNYADNFKKIMSLKPLFYPVEIRRTVKLSQSDKSQLEDLKKNAITFNSENSLVMNKCHSMITDFIEISNRNFESTEKEAFDDWLLYLQKKIDAQKTQKRKQPEDVIYPEIELAHAKENQTPDWTCAESPVKKIAAAEVLVGMKGSRSIFNRDDSGSRQSSSLPF